MTLYTLSSIPVLRAQAGAFLPKLLEQAELLKGAETTKSVLPGAEKVEEDAEKEDKAISELNVILVYKKMVQGLIYSPPDCEKHLALGAKPRGSVALALTLARMWQRH